MGIFDTILRVKRLATQAIGVLVALFGVFLVLAMVPPGDAEAGIIFAIGLAVVLLGASIVRSPGSVGFGTSNADDDEPEFDGDGDRRQDQRF